LLEQWIASHPYDFTTPGALPIYRDIARLIAKHESAASYSLKFQHFEHCIPLLKKSTHTWDLFHYTQSELEVPIKSTNEDSASHQHIRKLDVLCSQLSSSYILALSAQAEQMCSLKQLKDVSSRINLVSSAWIAEEITRMQLELFLRIEVVWLI
jgi:hypothetical protein